MMKEQVVFPGGKMEVAALAAQQAQYQMNAALSMVKKNAEADQALVNVLVQNSADFRGQNFDVTV